MRTAKALGVKAIPAKDLELDVSLNHFIEWQRKEPTFRHAYETAVSEEENSNSSQGVFFLVREGLLHQQDLGMAEMAEKQVPYKC